VITAHSTLDWPAFQGYSGVIVDTRSFALFRFVSGFFCLHSFFLEGHHPIDSFAEIVFQKAARRPFTKLESMRRFPVFNTSFRIANLLRLLSSTFDISSRINIILSHVLFEMNRQYFLRRLLNFSRSCAVRSERNQNTPINKVRVLGNSVCSKLSNNDHHRGDRRRCFHHVDPRHLRKKLKSNKIEIQKTDKRTAVTATAIAATAAASITTTTAAVATATALATITSTTIAAATTTTTTTATVATATTSVATTATAT
jgi:hypothetical protein